VPVQFWDKLGGSKPLNRGRPELCPRRLFEAVAENTLPGNDHAQHYRAEPLLVHALQSLSQQLAMENPDTAVVRTALGALRFQQGRFEEAQALLQQALAIKQKQLSTAD